MGNQHIPLRKNLIRHGYNPFDPSEWRGGWVFLSRTSRLGNCQAKADFWYISNDLMINWTISNTKRTGCINWIWAVYYTTHGSRKHLRDIVFYHNPLSCSKHHALARHLIRSIAVFDMAIDATQGLIRSRLPQNGSPRHMIARSSCVAVSNPAVLYQRLYLYAPFC